MKIDPGFQYDLFRFVLSGVRSPAMEDWLGNPDGIDPESSYAYCNRGSARRRLADYEGAIEDLTRAIELRPDYALAYNNRGYARMRSGDPEGAIDDYGEAIRLGDSGFPSYSLAMTYRNRAKAHRMVGEVELAVWVV